MRACGTDSFENDDVFTKKTRAMNTSQLAQAWSEDEACGIGQTSPDRLDAMEDLLKRPAPP